MNKTLRISFSLKNAYRVNGILYSLKQIPLIKKLLPAKLYSVYGLKIFANVLSVLWEIVNIFLGKFLYFLLLIGGMSALYENVQRGAVYLHIFFFLTIFGGYGNTEMFHPSRDKYYAMILMRMNARNYTLVNYTYSIFKVVLGFLPFSLWFGMKRGIPFWVCVLLPFSVTGLKLAFTAFSLWRYEHNGQVYNEDKGGKAYWLSLLLILGAAYGLPALGIVLPETVSAGVMLLFIPAGILGIKRIYSFPYYREVNQQLLIQVTNQMDSVAKVSKAQNEKLISADTGITSRKKGFEYLNELFIRRHQKILWKASKKIAWISACVFGVILLAFFYLPEIRGKTNELLMTFLPYFVFILYSINRGSGFTRALFMNCDHSLLTYSFFKEPSMILKLFRIRLREIIKVNLLPAFVIGVGLAVLLYASGGTENPMNYVVLVVSVLFMSMFFSVHYLTIYYLLQPYNAGTEMKSGTYPIVTSATYFICFFLMQVRMPTLLFGGLCIVFCFLYIIVACVLVYRLAPRTFRLRT